MNEAEAEIVNTVPTTMAGVLALLAYIDTFNRREIRGPEGWHSEAAWWTTDEYGDEEIRMADGKPLRMVFPFWIMRNVEAALRNLAA